MSLHINPTKITQDSNGIVLSPEVMIIYSEGTQEFEYIRSLIGSWDYYISPTVSLPNATATAEIQVNDVVESKTSNCSAYIYGWMPGSAEWIQGSCVAIVFFDVPQIAVPYALSYTVRIRVEDGYVIAFSGVRTVPIYYAAEDSVSENDKL